MSKGQAKNTDNNWKDKAQERAKEIQRLKKRLKEVSYSRSLWKNKYQNVCKSCDESSPLGGEKAKFHQ